MPSPERKNTSTLEALIDAVDVMQKHYFELWEGLWPTAIDWTAAVTATHLSAVMSTLSSSADYILRPSLAHAVQIARYEGLINRYFSHLIGFYFGQDAVTIRSEAYDDMLWVVLEWLEAIKFINLHSSLHYGAPTSSENPSKPAWYGGEWIPAFAHRANIFWDLASQGWDTSLCGGGMIWSPHLQPYKNAITNELFIAASVEMYLHFPGDANPSPFAARDARGTTAPRPPVGPRDPKYLAAALEAYEWLAAANMTNAQGLYVDGFHISGGAGGTRCDARNEMVYSYNQGVLLSGQRGLWEVTGARAYLADGHRLVASVAAATGFDLAAQRPDPGRAWRGLGRGGVVEDACDAGGDCGQDGQAFKGIFFHHLARFCGPLGGEGEVQRWHAEGCAGYRGWIEGNARAAGGTLNAEGVAGMWWGAGMVGGEGEGVVLPEGAVDYRNEDGPGDGVWRGRRARRGEGEGEGQQVLRGGEDANDRGRGRTVETQGGLVGVLRALCEVGGGGV